MFFVVLLVGFVALLVTFLAELRLPLLFADLFAFNVGPPFAQGAPGRTLGPLAGRMPQVARGVPYFLYNIARVAGHSKQISATWPVSGGVSGY